MNMFEYVTNFQASFSDEPFNEVDNLILSNLTYLDFTNIVPNNKVSITLKDAGDIYLSTYKRRDIARLGIAQKDAYKLLGLVIKSKLALNTWTFDLCFQSIEISECTISNSEKSFWKKLQVSLNISGVR